MRAAKGDLGRFIDETKRHAWLRFRVRKQMQNGERCSDRKGFSVYPSFGIKKGPCNPLGQSGAALLL